jgi:hypothetical protein
MTFIIRVSRKACAKGGVPIGYKGKARRHCPDEEGIETKRKFPRGAPESKIALARYQAAASRQLRRRNRAGNLKKIANATCVEFSSSSPSR